MLFGSEVDGALKAHRALFWTFLLLCLCAGLNATPLPTVTQDYNIETANPTDNSSSVSLDDDLYVIKAVVYEIGILTDADNATTDASERQEVNISLYDQSYEDDEVSKRRAEASVSELLLSGLSVNDTAL